MLSSPANFLVALRAAVRSAQHEASPYLHSPGRAHLTILAALSAEAVTIKVCGVPFSLGAAFSSSGLFAKDSRKSDSCSMTLVPRHSVVS